MVFNLFFKEDLLKVKLANHKFSKIGDGPYFLVFGGVVIGGRVYELYVSLKETSYPHVTARQQNAPRIQDIVSSCSSSLQFCFFPASEVKQDTAQKEVCLKNLTQH